MLATDEYLIEPSGVWPTFITEPEFEKGWKDLNLTDDAMMELERVLARNPRAGPLIDGAGGFRKYRFQLSDSNRGQSAGARIIYIEFVERSSKIYLSRCYSHKGIDILSGRRKMKTIKWLRNRAKEYKEEN